MEISPSGTGFLVVVAGQPPAGTPCRVGPVELYTHGRYLTITGRRLESHPVAVADAGDRLQWLAEHYLPSRVQSSGLAALDPSPILIPDAELLARATAHHRTGMRLAALLRGEPLDHRSQSEADYELTRLLGFWCGGDEERVIRLMRASGAARDKWDDRPDYLPRTVRRAVSRLSCVYSGASWSKPVPSPYTPTCVDKSVSLPIRSVAEQAERLVAHIRVLRNRTGRPVGVSARQAKDVIGRSTATAARRLNQLVEHGRLILVTKGTNANRLASEYDLPEFVNKHTTSPNPPKPSARPTGPPPYALTPGGSLGVWRWSPRYGEWRHFGDCPTREAADAVAGQLMARWPGLWSVGGESRYYTRGHSLRVTSERKRGSK